MPWARESTAARPGRGRRRFGRLELGVECDDSASITAPDADPGQQHVHAVDTRDHRRNRADDLAPAPSAHERRGVRGDGDADGVLGRAAGRGVAPALATGVGTATAEIAFIESDVAAHHARFVSGLWTAPALVRGRNLAAIALGSSHERPTRAGPVDRRAGIPSTRRGPVLLPSAAGNLARRGSMLREFKDFVSRGNVVGLAVAVVLGAAFGVVVSSFVNDVLMQLVAALGAKPSFNELSFTLNGAVIRYGAFLNAVVMFLIVSFAMFLVVKAYHRLAPPEKKPGAETEVDVLKQIRDALLERRRLEA